MSAVNLSDMLDYRELDENSKQGLERMMYLEGTYNKHYDKVVAGEECVACLKSREQCTCNNEE